MCTCIACVFRREVMLQTGTGAGRRSGADFGMFAARVCVQVVCWVFDLAEKLPSTMAVVGVTSGDCVRA